MLEDGVKGLSAPMYGAAPIGAANGGPWAPRFRRCTDGTANGRSLTRGHHTYPTLDCTALSDKLESPERMRINVEVQVNVIASRDTLPLLRKVTEESCLSTAVHPVR